MKALKFLLAVAAAAVAAAVWANEILWTGGAEPLADGGYDWTNTLNWAGGKVPTSSDTAVFRPEGTLLIHPRRPSNSYCQFSGLRFESGSTYIADEIYTMYAATVTTTVYVAEGAYAVISNALDGWASNYRYGFRKTGAGTLRTRLMGKENGCKFLLAEEGAFLNNIVPPSVIPQVKTLLIRVFDGATFQPGKYNCTVIAPDVIVDEGGTFKLNGGSGTVRVGTLEGAGRVIDDDYWTDLRVAPGRDGVFSGTFDSEIRLTVDSTAAGRLVIGAADTLAAVTTLVGSRNLAFAPNVQGPFLLGDLKANAGYPLVLEDTAGDPVSVSISFGDASRLPTFATSGAGDLTLRTDSTLTNGQIRSTGALVAESAVLTLGDGTAAGAFDFSTLSSLDVGGSGSSGQMLICGGTAEATVPKVVGAGSLAVRSPTAFGASAFTGALEVGADTALGPFEGQPKSIKFTADDKTLTLGAGSIAPVGILDSADAVTRATVALDGTTVRAHFANNTTYRPFGLASDPYVPAIGKGGAVLSTTLGKSSAGEYEYRYSTCISIPKAVVSAVTDGTDGGLVHRGYGDYLYAAPFGITGPLTGEGGILRVDAAVTLPAAQGFFGRGNLVLLNEQLRLDKRTSSGTILLTDASKTLTVEGGSLLTLRSDSSGAAMSAEIGHLSFASGAALVLRDQGATLGTAGGSTVRVTGESVPLQANGRVANVFGTKDAGCTLYFLGYDETSGFVPLAGALEQYTFEGAGATDALVFLQNSGAWHVTASDKEYAVESLLMKQQMGVHLGTNTKLAIGDGVHPAVIAFERDSGLWGSAGSTVSFGTAPALLMLAGHSGNATSHNKLTVKIAAANGLSVMGVADNTVFHAILLSGDNAYSGVTRIGSACVKAGHANCFSTGDVYVLPGERHGGEVRFVEPATWQNAFHVAGSGICNSEWDSSQGNGALSFQAAATVAGPVELTAPARFCTTGASVTGLVSGVVSGDRLNVYYSRGVIELSGANTHTGGTFVTYGTLALRRGDAAGTGAVTLDHGTLRFTNTQPITFTNDVSGVGTIAFDGTAPVTLSGPSFASLPFGTFLAGTTLDVANPANNVYVPSLAGDVDLGGASVTVGGLSGSCTVANGALTVTGAVEPGGTDAVGLLTLDCAVTFAAGAKLVVEDDGAAMDRLVLTGAADLANLALDYRVLGKSRSRRVAVVLAAESVTGEFTSVAKSGSGASHAQVEYAAASASINPNVRGTLVIVK